MTLYVKCGKIYDHKISKYRCIYTAINKVIETKSNKMVYIKVKTSKGYKYKMIKLASHKGGNNSYKDRPSFIAVPSRSKTSWGATKLEPINDVPDMRSYNSAQNIRKAEVESKVPEFTNFTIGNKHWLPSISQVTTKPITSRRTINFINSNKRFLPKIGTNKLSKTYSHSL